MDIGVRIEQQLAAALARAQTSECPPLLAEAIRYSVVPGGARIRPRLCLAVAGACAAEDMTPAFAAATAIELLHCASLVHDDLPCFDDAAIRRGKPSVHVAFGEPLAVLAGDALIVLAFDTLAANLTAEPSRLAAIIGVVAGAVGAQGGIIAGQAWECEKTLDRVRYQRAKTGSLFAACTMAGAAAAGYNAQPWRALGLAIGEAFQVADDIKDATGTVEDIGKPAHQDETLDRPNCVGALGLAGARRYFHELLDSSLSLIPPCPGADALAGQIVATSKSLLAGTRERRAA